MDTIVSLVVKVLWKLISLICFRVYLEVNVHKNPTCFSRWSVRQSFKTLVGGELMAYNKITLYGKQTCDYLYIQADDPDAGRPENDAFTCVNDEPTEWNDTTSLYANFNNKESRLAAGNSTIVGSISGYEVYRRKYNESNAEYIGTVRNNDSNKNLSDIMIDYAVKNGVEYIYYLFPNVETTESGTQVSPVVTKQLAIDAPYWSLLIVDETDEENVFYLDKMFKFELNLQIDDMTNNAQVSISQNFTKYPTLQYGASNYWSGSLSSLCGFIASNCVDYVQNVNMIEELKSISSWVEVGDTKGVSIINNPKKKTTDWVLTESGEFVPYFTYQWDEQYRWDDSYFWTSNDDLYSNKNSNLGRDISK